MEEFAEVMVNHTMRTVRYTGELNDIEVVRLIETIDELIGEEPRDPVYLYLYSYGGSYDATVALYDFIKSEDTEIITVAMGTSMSGASLIVACGDRRFAYPNTRFMIHGIQASISFGSHIDGRVEMKEQERINDKFIELLSKETGQSKDKVKDDVKRDLYLTAQEALDYGLIDDIIEKEK